MSYPYKHEMWTASLHCSIPEIKKLMKKLEMRALALNEFDELFKNVNTHCWDISNGMDHEKTKASKAALLRFFEEYLKALMFICDEAGRDYPSTLYGIYV